ncbi:hypothetical protein FOMPIDRAFT_94798 [Fomitopsis schrenkii]|uniref:Uncharacterized protein n=1 Tax=Fomitopsis schrenkii TaxID=2126942 RepID=S8EZI6_FOMSC|nr:hypothetical protein FOMPIDRAFT_94798 [Fomitopsis schrenkii]
MPKDDLLNLGLLELKAGDWIMARSLHNQGDPAKDVLQGFVPGSDLFNQDKWSAWQNHCKKVLGPEETRSSAPGSTPFEKYSDGSNIKPVHEGTRCYPTGFTYQRQNLFSAPNANSKLGPDGNLDVLTQYRALLTKVMDSITAVDPAINNGEPYKGRDWDYLPNDNVSWEPLAEDSQRTREVFPGRRAVFDRFYHDLHVPHAMSVPEIGLRGVALDLPVGLRFLAGGEHSAPLVKQKKSSRPGTSKPLHKSKKNQSALFIGKTGYLELPAGSSKTWEVSEDLLEDEDEEDEDGDWNMKQRRAQYDEDGEDEGDASAQRGQTQVHFMAQCLSKTKWKKKDSKQESLEMMLTWPLRH